MIRTTNPTLCAAIITAVFVAFECTQWLVLREARDAMRWPTTQGTVVAASRGWVNYGGGKRGGGHSRRPTPRMEYTYDVGGATYPGSRYATFRVGMSQEEVESILAAAPVGAPVTVYYNPDDPAASMLSPGTEHWAPMVWILRVVLALMSLFGWYWVYQGGFPERKGWWKGR